MNRIALTIALTLAPSALFAQGASGSVAASANAGARVEAEPSRALSAEGQAKLDATLRAAREQQLPEEPIRDRVAEGQAKGATEAQLLAAAEGVRARLEASQQAMVQAGRATPTGEEVQGGAQALERGATSAQLEALIGAAPSDRSLTVAFDVLARLTAEGMPVAQALAQVQSRLEARAPDAALTALVQANGSTKGGVAGGAVSGAASGAAAGVTAGAAAGANGAVQGAGAAVKGAVSGVVRKP